MTGKYGRYWSPRDFNLVHSFNSELLNDIIQSLVVIYKFAVNETKTNVYGESSADTGKMYLPGTQHECLVDFSDSTNKDEGFGPDKVQTIRFRFNERFMQQANVYPENGDLILFDDLYFETYNVIQEQYVGGQFDKQLSIICETHLTKLSNINLVEGGRE
jgi:hypothetical protein